MTRKPSKLLFTSALISSTLGTVLVSVTSVWLATAILQPSDVSPHSSSSSSQTLYRLSPIPAGADWTS